MQSNAMSCEDLLKSAQVNSKLIYMQQLHAEANPISHHGPVINNWCTASPWVDYILRSSALEFPSLALLSHYRL